MLIIYPIYMVFLLYFVKSLAAAKKGKTWFGKPPILIEIPLTGQEVAYTCGPSLDSASCESVMSRFGSITGATPVAVEDTNAYWIELAGTGTLFAGVELESLTPGAFAYTIRMADYNLKTAVSYGSDGVVGAPDAKPAYSLAEGAYVDSGFIYIQRTLDCSLALELSGASGCGPLPTLASFPTVRIESFYSTDSTLDSLVPFYM